MFELGVQRLRGLLLCWDLDVLVLSLALRLVLVAAVCKQIVVAVLSHRIHHRLQAAALCRLSDLGSYGIGYGLTTGRVKPDSCLGMMYMPIR